MHIAREAARRNGVNIRRIKIKAVCFQCVGAIGKNLARIALCGAGKSCQRMESPFVQRAT